MSDSSDDEDLAKFREAVDDSFMQSLQGNSKQKDAKGIHKGVPQKEAQEKRKSERYLEEASHYNDVKVPDMMQKQIGAKISAIIAKKIEFVDVNSEGVKEAEIQGGVKLFKDSSDFLSTEEVQDTYTGKHNETYKKLKKKKRKMEENTDLDENDKLQMAAVSGEFILSKEDTKYWKSRRKEKIFKYKQSGKSTVLTSLEE